MSYPTRGPLPDLGPPSKPHDGSQPGDVFSNGRWVLAPDGKSFINQPAPSGSDIWFPPGDGHPMPPGH